jgi:hypothetical protein
MGAILTVIIILAIFGVVLWAINRYIPMNPTIKGIVNVVAIILIAVWLLQRLGVVH